MSSGLSEPGWSPENVDRLLHHLTRIEDRLRQLFALAVIFSFGSLLVKFLTATTTPGQAQSQPSDGNNKKKIKFANGALPPPPPVLRASEHLNDGKRHLLLAATGSVATIKIPNIIQSLSRHRNLAIRVLLTDSAAEFLQGQSDEQPSLTTLSRLPNVEAIHLDRDEWQPPWTRAAPILHIELRRWADLMCIAPLSANSLAKIALGLSDHLVASVARAWDTTGLIDPVRRRLPGGGVASGKGEKKVKGMIVAPAMNTAMWNHPVTRRHVAVLEEEWGEWVEVLRPVEKDLACGDVGGGAMREWKEIVSVIEERLRLHDDD
ncbi:flavo [Lecanosticta acicola]|uniref:Flavo n=1 Tax=Lecanosticta acicola TaxID=111012 RepID=A0AAI8Z5X0_9PEZI|nr:flavo [Lecanosticta acicola]